MHSALTPSAEWGRNPRGGVRLQEGEYLGSGVERNWRGWAIDTRQFGGPKLAWRHAIVLPESTTEMGAALESVRTGDVGNTASCAKRIPEQASALLQSAALDVTRYALTLITKEQV